MKQLEGACVIGQSGGPTPVINASVYGAAMEGLASEGITQILAAQHGISGILRDRLFDLGREDPGELELLKNTPSCALGSVRYKLKNAEDDEADYQRVLEVFKKHNIRFFFYVGGNDSMDTCDKLSRYIAASDWDCNIIGIPKTIDNDLFGTDHCPGYGSAAKYISTVFTEVSQDCRVYDKGQITIIELMGRNAGWLTGSAALAGVIGSGPDLVYLPERPFDIDAFWEDVREVYARRGSCMVAVSEGIRNSCGKFISEMGISENDAFGHVQLGGLAAKLASGSRERTGAKVRGIELSLLQRCGAHLASGNDLKEAELAGRAAVRAALEGHSGKMVAFERLGNGGQYACGTKLVDLAGVANTEKTVPQAWINERGNGVTQQFLDYALPLIQGDMTCVTEFSLPRYARLKKHFV